MLQEPTLRCVIVDRGRGLVFVRPEGTLDFERCREIFWQIRNDRRAHGLDRFIDLSRVTEFDLSFATIGRLLPRRLDEGESRRLRGHCAILAESEIGYGLARMYQALMDGRAATIGVFRSRAAVAEWLGIAEELLAREARG